MVVWLETWGTSGYGLYTGPWAAAQKGVRSDSARKPSFHEAGIVEVWLSK